MGQQSLIYSFVARGTVILAEYTEFTGNFTSIASQCLQKLPASNNKFTYNCDGHTFNYLVENGFSESPPPLPPCNFYLISLLFCLNSISISPFRMCVSAFLCFCVCVCVCVGYVQSTCCIGSYRYEILRCAVIPSFHAMERRRFVHELCCYLFVFCQANFERKYLKCIFNTLSLKNIWIIENWRGLANWRFLFLGF